MNRIILGILGIALFFFILVPTRIIAQENFRAEEVSILEKGEIVNKDYFAWGEKVVLSGTVNGDAYIAGGNVIMDGIINGDLLVAGGNVNILGKVSGDIRSAGGNINISGEVGGNVTSVGGNTNIEKAANISGSLVSGSGNVQAFGPIGKGVTVGAGTLTLGNIIGSDVLAAVGQIDISSSANVNGDVTYISDKKIGISKDATISGEVKQLIPPKVDVPEKNEFFAVFKFGWNLYMFLATLFVGIILLIVAPNYANRAGSLISEKPWMSLGVGLLTLIVSPVIIILFFITAIGIPMGILLLVYFIFLVCFAKIYTAVFVGEKVLDLFKMKQNIFLTLTLGLIVLSLLDIIPFVGGVVAILSTLAGVGAAVLAKKELFLSIRSKKQI